MFSKIEIAKAKALFKKHKEKYELDGDLLGYETDAAWVALTPEQVARCCCSLDTEDTVRPTLKQLGAVLAHGKVPFILALLTRLNNQVPAMDQFVVEIPEGLPSGWEKLFTKNTVKAILQAKPQTIGGLIVYAYCYEGDDSPGLCSYDPA